MESEDMNEEVEWEAKRVAAAFGVPEWERSGEEGYFHFGRGEIQLECFAPHGVGGQSCYFEMFPQISAGQPRSGSCWVGLPTPNEFDEAHAWPSDIPAINEAMVKGLYRLGIDTEVLFHQLPTLGAHEKLELRLSMPREFWPKKWLEEEGLAV